MQEESCPRCEDRGNIYKKEEASETHHGAQKPHFAASERSFMIDVLENCCVKQAG